MVQACLRAINLGRGKNSHALVGSQKLDTAIPLCVVHGDESAVEEERGSRLTGRSGGEH